jgi:acyl carrier protein
MGGDSSQARVQRRGLDTVGQRVDNAPSVATVVMETAAQVFRQPVRHEDSLLELGVDSLSVIEYCRRLEERLGVEVDVEELFAAESFASFGAALAARVSSGTSQ